MNGLALLLLLLATVQAVRVVRRNVAGGWDPLEREYTWVVAVYKARGDGFEHICGGSLVREDAVLSAAHCFWNNGEVIPVASYRITAGNKYRDYNSTETKQLLEVDSVIVHERYRAHELKFAHDIAIVRLKQKARMTSRVGVIGVDFSPEFEDDQLRGNGGIVVGWGLTSQSQPSESRVAAYLPYVNFDTCWKTVPRSFRGSITPDKFCSGLQNGTSVCPGDSGGGLAFEEGGPWYVRGIVSVAPQPEGDSKCHTTQFSAFTSVSAYASWLKSKLR